MAEIAVVVTCHDYGRFLDEAIDSVEEQTFRDLEVVVVDDGSTEPETVDLLSTWGRPGVRLIRTENQGASAARNTGIRACTSPYICCLDADDRLLPRYLESTRDVLDRDTEGKLGFATTWLRRFGSDTTDWHSQPYSEVEIALTCSVHAASLFRREAWEAAGGYRESFEYGEDWNLWISIVAAGYEWEVVPEVLFLYRRHGTSRSDRATENRLELFETIVADNPDFYRRLHPRLLSSLYRRWIELEATWSAQADLNRAYRSLEDYCRHVERELGNKMRDIDALEKELDRLRSLVTPAGHSDAPEG